MRKLLRTFWGVFAGSHNYTIGRASPGMLIGEATPSSHQGELMARKRFQHGSLRLVGKKEKKWVAKWREDVILTDGSLHRVQRAEVLGTRKPYPTKSLAKRALEQRLTVAEVNSKNYRAKPTATFREFAIRWQRDVLTQLKPSTQAADKSRIRMHLLPELGELCMKDITSCEVQAMIAKKQGKISPKSIRNMVATLRIMWTQAMAWGYTQQALTGLVLPESGVLNERFLTLDEMKLVIDSATEPYKTYYWILAETGFRAGEIGALSVNNLLLELGAIKITQSVWHGKIQTVKSAKGNRLCEISPELVEHLRQYLRRWRPNQLGLLFATRNGTPWDTDVVRKRKLYPLLAKLGIPRCGFHTFRHGNETVMDRDSVPMALRQTRLGHSDAKTTMRYSHVISEDGRQFAARLGKRLTESRMPVMATGSA
jgi:integrase